MENKFNINQIVKGKKAGKFVVLGYRTLLGEKYVQVKEVDTKRQITTLGEFALPEDALEEL